jgi:integrase
MGRRGNGEGNIYRRKDGLYEARYTIQTETGTKRRSFYAKTRKEAADKLAEALANREKSLTHDAGSTTVGRYLSDWLTESVEGSVRKSTFVRYEGIVRVHLSPTLGWRKLKNLDPIHVRKLYRQKIDVGLSPRSVQYIHTTLKKALGQAVLDGKIPRNVCDAVKPPQVHKDEVTPFTAAEVRSLLEAARGDRLEALYVAAIHTGLRQGEILGLKWSDVDLEAGTLTVQRSLSIYGTFNPPKRKNSRRTVKLTQTALQTLVSHRARQNEERLKTGPQWADMGIVFPNRAGKPMDAGNLYNRDWKSLLRRAGLPDAFTFHTCRHTFATTLLRQNVNPKIVQHQLGHATISQTLDTYSHVMPEMGDIAADALEAAFS